MFIFVAPPAMAILLTGSFYLGWLSYRRYLYQKYDKVPPEKTSSTNSSEEFIESKDFVADINWESIDKQNKFQGTLSLSLGLLFSAFIIFATTVSYYGLSQAYLSAAYLTEVTCMAGALVLILRSRKEKVSWLTVRTRAELARRSSFLLVCLNEEANQSTLDQNQLHDKEVQAKLSDTAVKEFKAIVDNDLEIISSKARQISASQARIDDYSIRRIFRQFHWFKQSEERTSAQIRHRSRLVMSAFFFVLALTIVKAFDASVYDFELLATAKGHLNFAILVAAGFTIVSGGFYFNTGIGSLRARYQRQAEFIKNLLDEGVSTMSHILEFEDLMNRELKFFLEGVGSEGIEISI